MERLTKNKRQIIQTLHKSTTPLYGLEIAQLAGIPSGSLYPALRDLRRTKLVNTEWRTPEDDPDGQPLRYYQLSSTGTALAEGLRDGSVQGTEWKRFVSSGRT